MRYIAGVVVFFVLGAVALWFAPASAGLKAGDKAPNFALEASLAGKPFTFKLDEALTKGPVVLYFYPAAFTPGCTVEANEFAEATDDFAKHGATVIGVSTDNLETLHKFSVSECRSKFAVAADPTKSVTEAYDAVMKVKPDYADRISYVIAPDSTILYVHKGLPPRPHIEKTLEAVTAWEQQHQ